MAHTVGWCPAVGAFLVERVEWQHATAPDAGLDGGSGMDGDRGVVPAPAVPARGGRVGDARGGVLSAAVTVTTVVAAAASAAAVAAMVAAAGPPVPRGLLPPGRSHRWAV